jgi:hypothetical protein
METLLRDSSAVEQEAVNFKVLGSNPSRGAEFLKLFQDTRRVYPERS